MVVFSGFITQTTAPLIFMFVFMAAAFIIVYLGVDNGIEKCSKILMPILLVLIIGIAVFSLTINHTDENGVTRTALEGFKNLTLSRISVA